MTPSPPPPAPRSPGAPAWRGWSPGTRVVVRRRLSAAEAAASSRRWTDHIGVVVAVDDDGLVLRGDAASSRESPLVRVAAADVEAAKEIPPRPPRRAPRAAAGS